MQNDALNLFSIIKKISFFIVTFAALVIVLLFMYVSYTLLIKEKSDKRIPNIVETDATTKIKKEYVFLDTQKLSGTSIVRISLVNKDRKYGSYKGGSYATPVNFLFLQTKSNKSHWLFPDNKQDIQQNYIFYENPMGANFDRKNTTVAHVYVVRNLDATLPSTTQSSSLKLMISEADGANIATLDKAIQSIEHISQIDGEHFLVLYKKENQLRSAIYSISRKELISEAPIPKIGAE